MPDDNDTWPERSSSLRDLVIVIMVTIVGTIALIVMDAFEALHARFMHVEAWELDDIFLGVGVLALALAWFAWRREREFLQILRQRAALESRLRTANDDLSFLIKAAPGVLYTCKPEGDFAATFMSPSIKAQLGYEPGDFTGDPGFWADHIHPEDKEQVFAGLGILFERGNHTHEYRFRRADGSYHWMHDQLSLFRDPDGKPERIVGFWIDISERKDIEQRLNDRVAESTAELRRANESLRKEIKQRKQSEQAFKRMAETDALTGLPNRILFHERLQSALDHAQRTGSKAGVMLLDLDHFKNINDTMGHRAGDALLCEVTSRILDCTANTDTVARLGGDEFAIIATNIKENQGIEFVANRIISAISEPFNIDGHEVYSGGSIGITIFPKSDGSPGDLLRSTDIALFHAKKNGRGIFSIYDDKMNNEVQSRQSIEIEFRKAMENGDLEVYYQPQVNIRSGRIDGAEALLRWRHPERGMIPPAEFIPIAEFTRLIIPLGKWVLKTACQQNKKWQDQGLPPIVLAVNVSPLQFMHHDMLASVTNTLKTTGLDSQWLEIEITEALAMKKQSVDLLSDLREIGVLLAIDDFGTGYSSLSRLQNFPIDRLKIDQSFVRSLQSKRNNSAVATAIIQLGHSMGLGIIAEGVETMEELDLLRQMGCDEAQGFVFAPAMPAKVFSEFLRIHSPKVDLTKLGTDERSHLKAG